MPAASTVDDTTTVYVVEINGRRVQVPGDQVIGWVRGVADAMGKPTTLDGLDHTLKTRRMRQHALQLGHAAGLFTYLHSEQVHA